MGGNEQAQYSEILSPGMGSIIPEESRSPAFRNSLYPGVIGICVDSRRPGLLEKNIEFFSGGQAYHVFGVISATEVVEAKMGEGVVRSKIEEYQKGSAVIMLANPTFLRDEERDAIVRNLIALEGSKYDNLNIIGKMFKMSLDSKKAYICSELIAVAYGNYYRFLGLRPENVTPADIYFDVTHNNTFDCEYLIHT